ncbi:aminotransferase class IV [Corynebacterium pygosceleis]|uniref:4-amino-4-deoxychorismate lyase n=1 Tax=Corynebacterium pygosceleis TaxID=2800406 RepID=A0A9Q4CBE4_9CORY|nr:aminotransferase class IV [Corynebacterium pygosceleis]MCK7638184.1 aminotransferase class IV [Corynebacterium pygosceleis]MCK7675897.1 aminotransferase class IV [Corynebacterium pygosceleis]MCL0120721.1 aminotransferase class IV [Corynebacterium pygosceleis]MCX7444261.1 hypothetical protein [Corynebacterium pygosceleis]MCX7468900.1 hypothetical protein [Corynebacterium pygosceleis]
MSGTPRLVTSFRMIDGRVRCWGEHIRRLGPLLRDGDEALIRARLRDAGPGSFNPLVSVGAGGPQVLIRPDREVDDRVVVDAVGHRDLRRHPTVKGPDLDWLAGRLGVSRGRGAGEGLLLDDAGCVIEAVYSAVLMLGQGTATLLRHHRSLDSTTAAGVVGCLREAGWEVTERGTVRREELMCSPVWLLNAFSGVRAVTGWVTADGRGTAPDAVAAGPAGISGVSGWLMDHATEI